MPFVITDPCIGTKDTACVDVCPVDCIHPRKDEAEFETAAMLYIHPEECIDCGACVPECPVEAIYDEAQLPDDKQQWLKLNAERAVKLPVISEQVDPLPGAEKRKEELGF
jgi:ferredoxin